MPSPSLHNHYSCFITTTDWSAAIVAPQPRCSFPPAFRRVWRNIDDFTCSDVPPGMMSCQLNPGRDTASHPAPAVLVQGANVTTLFSLHLALTRLHHWFTCVQLIIPQLRGSCTSLLNPSLITVQFPAQQHGPF
jgi:hypothetical protein